MVDADGPCLFLKTSFFLFAAIWPSVSAFLLKRLRQTISVSDISCSHCIIGSASQRVIFRQAVLCQIVCVIDFSCPLNPIVG